MYSRGIALCSIFALTTVAQGGVQIQLVPTPNQLLYPPSSVVQVDVKLAQTPGGSDQLLRLVELDMQNTSTSLTILYCAGGANAGLPCTTNANCPGSICVTLPRTHDKGTPDPATGDDLFFWTFSSLANCVSTPSFCGYKHFVDFSQFAGPVDLRLKMLSTAFYGLLAEGPAQIALPASGTPVTVGKLQVTMPASPGNYTLSMMAPSDAGADRGARVDFGFDPHIIWRDRAHNANCTGAGTPLACCIGPGAGACPAEITGGTLTFSVCSSNPCTPNGSCCVSGNCSITTQASCSGTWNLGGTCSPNPCQPTVGPSVVKWESVLTHGATVGPVALDIPNTGLFSEPRSGIKKVVVTFDGALNPLTAIPANVTVCGNNSGGSPVDLSGVTITTAMTTGDTKMEINFAPRLPDYSRYRIVLNTSIQGALGGAIQAGTGGLSRILTALQGNAGGGNLIINSADVGGARSLLNTDPINAANINHVRSDANNDGKISSADVGGIRSFLNRDAGSIPDPVCP